jgi:hypothetical protein
MKTSRRVSFLGQIISVYFKIIQKCIITLCGENIKLLHIKIGGMYYNKVALNGTIVTTFRAVTRTYVDKFADFKVMPFFATFTCLLILRNIRVTKQESKSRPSSLYKFRK